MTTKRQDIVERAENYGTLAQEQRPSQSDASLVLETISRVASDPNVDIEKFKELMAMRREMELQYAEREFNAAMTAAQAEMRLISTDATNPQTKSKYASYGKLDKHLRPIYTKHGFALSFDEGDSPADMVQVVCFVSHSSGFTRRYHRNMPADGKGAKGGDVMTKTHAAGAAMSYGMRYLLKGIFNIAIGEDDTDGNDPTERISEKQVADLEALIEEVAADRAKFLRYIKVDSLEQIPAKNYQAVVQLLEAKRRK